MIDPETRPLTAEEYAALTARSRPVAPDHYMVAVAAANAALAAEKALFFADGAAGVAIMPTVSKAWKRTKRNRKASK